MIEMIRMIWEYNPVETAALVAVTVICSVLMAICLMALVIAYID